MDNRTPQQRFWVKVNKNGPIPANKPELGPCWVWTACIARDGYGLFSVYGIKRGAHRVAYEWINGTIPCGLTLDHLCRNRACVNPWHLEAVTMHENMLRGENYAAQNARKTHCKRGHPFDGKNTQIRPNGYRRCIMCVRLYNNHLLDDIAS